VLLSSPIMKNSSKILFLFWRFTSSCFLFIWRLIFLGACLIAILSLILIFVEVDSWIMLKEIPMTDFSSSSWSVAKGLYYFLDILKGFLLLCISQSCWCLSIIYCWIFLSSSLLLKLRRDDPLGMRTVSVILSVLFI